MRTVCLLFLFERISFLVKSVSIFILFFLIKNFKIYKSLINKGDFVKNCHFFVSKDILTKEEKHAKIAVTRGGICDTKRWRTLVVIYEF